MVQALLGAAPSRRRPDHAADALAVAICHANHAPLARAAALAAAAHDRARRAARSPSAAPTTSSSRRPAASATAWPSRPRRCATCRRSGEHGLAAHPPHRPRRRARASTASRTEEERDLFLLLIGVQAVGPKVALAVLSGGAAARAASARWPPATRRASRPCPGIGKRTAERIIVELREKVGVADRLDADGDDHRRARDRRPARARPRRPGRARLRARRRPSSLLDGAAGDTPEDLHRASALQGGRAPMSMPRRASRPPAILARAEDELDRSLRPPTLDEFVGQEAVTEQLAVSLEAARRARRGARPRPARRPAGPRQDLARADRRRRARRAASSRPPARRSSARATSPRS